MAFDKGSAPDGNTCPPIEEPQALAHGEVVIERGLASFFAVGQAMATTLEKRLYRSDHKTFDEYSRDKRQMLKFISMNNLKELLQEMLVQNRITNAYALDRITNENKHYRLNNETASIGFIYRHIGETMNLLGYFLGVPSDIQNTTMGQQDTGQDFELETSKLYMDKGYKMLEDVIRTSKDEDWSLTTDTPFFGTVSRMRLFAHILFHNAHHAGQISLTLSKGTTLA